MDQLVSILRAAAEPTRLRLLALCAEGDITVSELTQIVGQSQPRVSRHLRLLCEAGLLHRSPEGSWVFYGLADGGTRAADIARLVADLVPPDDPTIARDRARLAAVRKERADAAQTYFRANAERWNRIRSMHVDDAEVERAILELLPPDTVSDLLDIGTGTARMLELYGPRIGRGVGIDLSREMLAVARDKLEAAGLAHCQVRHADMYRLPFADGAFDAVTFHQVLHYVDDPAWGIAEASRVMRAGGRLVIVDLAPHAVEDLRVQHAHRRLGFADDEVREWLALAGLTDFRSRMLPGDPLTVGLWLALKPHPAAVVGSGGAAAAQGAGP